MSSYADIQAVLADQAEFLLDHWCGTIPGISSICRARISSIASRRRPIEARPCCATFNRSTTTGASPAPVTSRSFRSTKASSTPPAQSFAPNPIDLDPANICELAINGGCNAVASTLGVLGSVARSYAHKIPFILKFNHNELLTTPNTYDQTMFASMEQAFEMGCVGVGATIYWGSDESNRQLQEVSAAFQQAHELGMFTVLWCYLRNSAFKVDGVDYHASADLTGQANHLGVTLEADIIKQKLPENNGGYPAIKAGKTHDKVYSELTTDHPIDLTRYQVANNYMGRMGLINSGGASGSHDLQDATATAVINKRAGGTGLISGRKVFEKPMDDGVAILNDDPGRLPVQRRHDRLRSIDHADWNLDRRR